MFPLQSHVISLVIEFQAISVNIIKWLGGSCFVILPSVCILPLVCSLQSAVCILPLVCILPPVCSLQSAVRSLRFTLTVSQTPFLILLSSFTGTEGLTVRPTSSQRVWLDSSTTKLHAVSKLCQASLQFSAWPTQLLGIISSLYN